jgi:hypothetical protein
MTIVYPGLCLATTQVVITNTVPVICHAEGMTRFFYAKCIRIFDYPRFARTLRERQDVRAAGQR